MKLFLHPAITGSLLTTLLLSSVALAGASVPISAQTMPPALTPESALERLFTQPKASPDWFVPEFLDQVPIAQVQQIIQQIQTQLGKYGGVRSEGKGYRLEFERGFLPTTIVLNTQGKITGLIFQTPVAKHANLEAAAAGFKALPGQVSLLVLEGNQDRIALKPEEVLAVGSSFKLAILQALQAQIKAGDKSWQTVVPLQPQSKSLPTGILQTWPDQSPLTLHTLAALMISQSDNTATDTLLQVVGKPAIESLSPRNRPFLSTREAFALKNPQNLPLLQRYRSGGATEKQAVLSELIQAPLIKAEAFTGPIAQDVEWFFTTRELCGFMQQVKDLPLMSINPGVANPTDWQRVSFKGGSEPGIINLTTWLETKSGKQFCVSATWNHTQSLEEGQFFMLYGGILEVLRQK